MGEARTAPQAAEFRGGHLLFVEGDPGKGRDIFVLDDLLGDLGVRKPRIVALGPSFYLQNVAQALHPTHPRYYFLIDRDYRFSFNGGRDWDSYVERTWRRFPDPEENNLLIWRRKELENYFLIPEYLGKSAYLACTAEQLAARITETCARRVYLDTANLVIAALREGLKENWVAQFAGPDGFGSADDALAKLLSCQEIISRPENVSNALKRERIEEMFRGFVGGMLGGCDGPVLGRGRWLEMVCGSQVLPEIVSSCFKVKNVAGVILQGAKAIEGIAKDLLRRELSDQPADFRQLHEIMRKHTARPA